ncbi:MAG TPA: EmrB/QacA family drug resistance transporter, partial [Acidiphilium sp.]
ASITPYNRLLQVGGAVTQYLDPVTAHGAALLNSIIDMQAEIISYIDAFKFMLIISVPAIFTLLLMRKPPATATAPAGKHEPTVME